MFSSWRVSALCHSVYVWPATAPAQPHLIFERFLAEFLPTQNSVYCDETDFVTKQRKLNFLFDNAEIIAKYQ